MSTDSNGSVIHVLQYVAIYDISSKTLLVYSTHDHDSHGRECRYLSKVVVSSHCDLLSCTAESGEHAGRGNHTRVTVHQVRHLGSHYLEPHNAPIQAVRINCLQGLQDENECDIHVELNTYKYTEGIASRHFLIYV